MPHCLGMVDWMESFPSFCSQTSCFLKVLVVHIAEELVAHIVKELVADKKLVVADKKLVTLAGNSLGTFAVAAVELPVSKLVVKPPVESVVNRKIELLVLHQYQ